MISISNLKGKKLLIMGGAYQHSKIVRAAKNLGVITYVTDFLPIEDAPAKQIADYPLMYNVTELDELVEFCKKEEIDGVVQGALDFCQRPYQRLCERLNLPCYGTEEQFRILTAPSGFIPTAVIKSNDGEEVIALSCDDTFKKSIKHFCSCIADENIRRKNYQDIVKQAELVDVIKGE